MGAGAISSYAGGGRVTSRLVLDTLSTPVARADAPVEEVASERARRELAPVAWPALIVLLVVLANLPALLGLIERNPLASYAGLTVSKAAPLLPGVSTIDIDVGATSQALGHLAALDWLHGHVPWWNPFEGVGTPLAAEMQSAAFFPLVLLLAVPSGQLVLHVLLETLAGLSTYFVLRRLGLTRPVSAVGGSLFALNGTFAWFAHSAVNPIPFLPMAVLGVEIACDRRLGDWRSLLLPAAVFCSITAGFPEMAAYDGGFVALWALWRLAGRPSARERVRFLGRIVVLAGGGVLLAAPLVLAFVSYLGQATVASHTSAMASIHLPPSGILTLIDPYLTGPLKAFVPSGLPEAVAHLFVTDSGYLLVSGFVLALAGLLLSRRHGSLRLLLLLFVVVVEARVYGFAPARFLFGLVPYVKASAVYRWSIVPVEFAVVVLAAFGLQAVADRRRGAESPHVQAAGGSTRARRWHLAALATGTGALLLLLAAGPSHTVLRLVSDSRFPVEQRPYLIGAVVGTGVILALLALGGAAGRRTALAALSVVVLLEAFASFVYPEGAATRDAKVDMAPVGFLRSHLGGARFFSLDSQPLIPPAYGGPVAPNYGSYFRLAEVDYLDLPDPALFSRYVNRDLDPRTSPQFFGTIIGRLPGPPSALEELRRNIGHYESIGVRYIVTGALTPLSSYVPTAKRVYLDSLVSIWRLPHARPYFSTSRGDCRLHRDGFDRVVAVCSRASVLEREELALSGWSATVNGKGARLRRTGDGLFSTVALPPGRSTVVFSYRPAHLRLGEGLALTGAVVLIAPVALAALRRRRRAAGVPEGETVR